MKTEKVELCHENIMTPYHCVTISYEHSINSGRLILRYFVIYWFKYNAAVGPTCIKFQ